MLRSALVPYFLFILCLSVTAQADNTATTAPVSGASTSAQPSVGSSIKPTASYLQWFVGPNMKSLSGNTDGKGMNLTARHFFAAGAKLTKDVSISATQLVYQYIDEIPDSVKAPYEFADPYLTLSHANIVDEKVAGFHTDGYIRYYVPISRATHDNSQAVKTNDAANGQVRLYVNNSKTFDDGKWNLAMNNFIQFLIPANTNDERIAKNGVKTRKDYRLWLNPNITRAISSKFEVYAEYGVLFDHTTDGKLTKFNDPAVGQYISPGINWMPTKKIVFNPYISFGPSFGSQFEIFKKGDIGFQFQYTFL